MKRIGNQFMKIVERSNFRLAFHKAAKGKRHRSEVRQFSSDLENNLRRLIIEVAAFEFPYGRAKQFTIYDPKQRVITAPSFPERILHHAILNVIESVFERYLIFDSYACRVGKGRIKALNRAKHFAGRYRFAMALDIKSYFASISHEILIEKLKLKFKDKQLLKLFSEILKPHQRAVGIGLPIGSLTSQHFANFYLGPYDRFVCERLGYPYLRYMDDSLIFGGSRSELQLIASACKEFLENKLQLRMKNPTIRRTRGGFPFLGCRVYTNHLKLNGRSRRRYRKKAFELFDALNTGEISDSEFAQRFDSMLSFARAGGTCSWKFRTSVLEKFSVNGHGLEPGEPGRELEQQPAELSVGEPQQEFA